MEVWVRAEKRPVDYAHMNLDEVIDGSTLEKRRDQRAELLERFLGTLDPDDRSGIPGTVTQWGQEEGVKIKPASESVFDLSSKTKKLRSYESSPHRFADLPPIVKRTPGQRVEALVAKFKDQPPPDSILAEVAGEYWKAGAPVTVDALRAVATHFLNRTERRPRKTG